MITTLPDLAKSASKLKLVMDLCSVKGSSPLACGIRDLMAMNRPNEAIKAIKDQLPEHREMLARVLGEELLQRVEKISI